MIGALTVTLAATGVVAATYAMADATPSPASLDFENVPAYETSAPKTVTITNPLADPVIFTVGSLEGKSAGDFKITNDGCSGKTLAQAETCSITATVRPSSASAIAADFVLPDNSAAQSTRIPLTANGYTSDKGTYYPLTPARILDTRSGLGAAKGQVKQGGVVHLQVTGAGGVPADASTVVLNVTVTGPTGGGYVSVFPTGVNRPTASSLNFAAGWRGAHPGPVKGGTGGEGGPLKPPPG